MSLFISFPYADRIELLTDGANYTEEGRLIFCSEKVFRSEQIPMAITGRGQAGMVRRLAAIFISVADKSRTFADVVREIESMFDRWRADGRTFGGRAFQMAIFGWDPAWGFNQFQVSSLPNFPYEGMEAMRINTIHGCLYAGPGLAEDELQKNLNLTPEILAKGPAYFGPDMVQYIRGKSDFTADDPKKRLIHGVGGHIDHTIVDERGARTTRLLTWPDKLLRKINPALPYTLGEAAFRLPARHIPKAPQPLPTLPETMVSA